jgi:chromosome-anchoring protein RacA
MNTAALAAKVGVTPKRIRKWIKQYEITCKKNEFGHYVFDEHDYLVFCEIHGKMNDGNPINKSDINPPRKGIAKVLSTTTEPPLQQSFEYLSERIDRNERRIEQKANEVVSYQLLQHRKEIDELNEKIVKLESYIQNLEKEKQEKKRTSEEPLILDPTPPKTSKLRRNKIIGLLFF